MLSKTPIHRLLWFFLCPVVLTGCGEDPAPGPAPADYVLLDGRVHTMDPDRTIVEALAIAGDKILAVGSNDALFAFIGDGTRVIRLDGQMVLPGFHDAHVHPYSGGAAILSCSLSNLDTIAKLLDRVRECAAREQDSDEWLVGSGWNLALFEDANPNKALLDEIVPNRPVFLAGEDGHSAWVNSRALTEAGISAASLDPPLGVIERDAETGEPTGTLRETAMGLVERLLPTPTAEERAEALATGIKYANQYGITALIDAAVDADLLTAYKQLSEDGELSARVTTSITYPPSVVAGNAAFESLYERRGEFAVAGLDTNAVKIFVDGVLEGETAALLEPYLGRDDHRGLLNFPPDALAAAVTRFDRDGVQIHLHAIGDRGVRVALDALESAARANPPRTRRHHVAHLQLIHEDDVPRFAELGVAPNFQSLWAYPEPYITEINLPVVGQDRVDRMYPIGSVARAGGEVVGGSDWPVSSINPLDAIQVALTREDPSGQVDGVLNARERVSLDTMLAAYTVKGARLMGREFSAGTIAVGKSADLVVLSADLFDVAPDKIREVSIEQTFFAGRVVYQRGLTEDLMW